MNNCKNCNELSKLFYLAVINGTDEEASLVHKRRQVHTLIKHYAGKELNTIITGFKYPGGPDLETYAEYRDRLIKELGL
jgi:hypothetical protein